MSSFAFTIIWGFAAVLAIILVVFVIFYNFHLGYIQDNSFIIFVGETHPTNGKLKVWLDDTNSKIWCRFTCYLIDVKDYEITITGTNDYMHNPLGESSKPTPAYRVELKPKNLGAVNLMKREYDFNKELKTKSIPYYGKRLDLQGKTLSFDTLKPEH